MCQDFGGMVKSLLQSLNAGGTAGDVIGALADGLGAVLKVIGDLFGSIELKLSFGLGFNVKTAMANPNDPKQVLQAFQDWKTSLAVTWNMGELQIPARILLTGVARLVSSVRAGTTCDNWDTVAYSAAVTIH